MGTSKTSRIKRLLKRGIERGLKVVSPKTAEPRPPDEVMVTLRTPEEPSWRALPSVAARPFSSRLEGLVLTSITSAVGSVRAGRAKLWSSQMVTTSLVQQETSKLFWDNRP